MGFRTYLWDRRRSWLLALGLLAVFLTVLLLFRLSVLAVGYGALLCGVLYLGAGIWDFVRWSSRHNRLQNLEQEVLSTLDNLPPPASSLEADYQTLLRNLFRAKAAQEAEASRRFRNMTDYYTLWAHQVKTPIAAMDLILQTQELPESGSLKQGLFQIQQYVEMVLCYLRLDSETTDFVIRTCPLDPIIRTALREFAPSFIHKGLQLHYTPVSCSVLTDEKWLLFVLEQLLSNAVKYTPQGSVSVYLAEPQTLVIRDTGLGIAPEDLPRVFEKGYTGQMGRADQRSTGIGLYLCRRTLRQLGHAISIQSTPGEGTAVSIHLQRRDLPME